MQVFRNDRSLNSYGVFDGKEIAIQLIPAEQVPADSCLIMVKLWQPSTWEISPTRHICVPKTATLNDFCTLVATAFDIKEKEHLECCKIASCWNFNRVQLPHEQFYGLLSGETYMQAKPFFMAQDGLLFVVRQANQVLRSMTEEEHIKFKTASFEQNTQGSDLPVQTGRRRGGAE